MMNIPSGKSIRMKRISEPNTGRFVIVPMDHGLSSGPINGLVDIGETINQVAKGGATGIVVHKGMVGPGLKNCGSALGLILHLSAITNLAPDPNEKVLVATVEEALRMGADAVSVHINIGAETEAEMLADLGEVSSSCREWQVPLLAMMYPRGPEIKDPFDVEIVKHVARVGAELGADIIKTNYTGSTESFIEVVKSCPVPVIIAGGPKMEADSDVLTMVQDAMRAGAAGISIGRNIFQHKNVLGMTSAIAKIILENLEVDEAIKVITG
jgi:predicted phospho-2-dehydro-3-deoxyheptonate aldolase